MWEVKSICLSLPLTSPPSPLSLLAFALLPQEPPNLNYLRKALGSLGMTCKNTSQFPCQWQTLLIN